MKPNSKILIAYASAYGTTAEVAKVIGETLSKSGAKVEVKHVSEVANLVEYDSVIIGAPIQFDKWLSDAREFVKTTENILRKMPVAYFFTCMSLSLGDSKEAQQYTNDLTSLSDLVKPVSVQGFAGAADFKKISFFVGIALRVILRTKGVKGGDYRDWKAIRAWAEDVGGKL